MLLFSKFKISGHSMDPFLVDGEIIFVSSFPYLFNKPKINDIVVFLYKKIKLVKRITKIHEDKYFLEGDNIKDSLDSNSIGFVSLKQILGKMIYKF